MVFYGFQEFRPNSDLNSYGSVLRHPNLFQLSPAVGGLRVERRRAHEVPRLRAELAVLRIRHLADELQMRPYLPGSELLQPRTILRKLLCNAYL